MSDVTKIKVEELLYNIKDLQLTAHKNEYNPHHITAQMLNLGKVDNLSKEELKDYIGGSISADVEDVKRQTQQNKSSINALILSNDKKLDKETKSTQSVNGRVNFQKGEISIGDSEIINEDNIITASKVWNFKDGALVRDKDVIIDAKAEAVIAPIEEVECNVTVVDGVATFSFSLPKGQDNVGPKGDKGSRWFASTLITGTIDVTTTTFFDAAVNDWALNPDTAMFYECYKVEDNTQYWNYIGTFSGPKGDKGDQGDQGETGETGEAGAPGTQFFTSATVEPTEEDDPSDFIFNEISEVIEKDFIINTITQMMYKCIYIDSNNNKHFSFSMNLGGQPGSKGETGPQGEPGPEGPAGVSPTVTVYSETDEEYILTITDVNNPEGYQTPNLKDGGTKVEPNPEEDATDTLNKIKIKDTVYELEGGAASGVYVGDDEPEEDNVSLWIDTSEDYPSGGGGSGSGGMMPDYNNLIETVEAKTYTATQDCYVEIYTYSSDSKEEQYYINGNLISRASSPGEYQASKGMFLSKGDVLSLRDVSQHSVTIRVYKLKGGSSGGSSKHKYSTDEQIVGEWIDGKPIYEKVNSLSRENVDIIIDHKEIIIKDENGNFDLNRGLIPLLTSNEGSNGNTIKSDYTSYYDAWRIFNHDRTTGDDCWYKNSKPCWVGYHFNEPQNVKSFVLRQEHQSPEYMRKFSFEASNDGENWIKLGDYEIECTPGLEKGFYINNDIKYSYYRWYFNDGPAGGISIQIAQMYDFPVNYHIYQYTKTTD